MGEKKTFSQSPISNWNENTVCLLLHSTCMVMIIYIINKWT